MPAGLTSAEGSLLGLQTAAFSLCPHTAFLSACWGTEKKQTLWGLFRKDTNPFVRAPSSGPHLKRSISHRPHFQIPSYWGLGLQHMGLGEGGDTQQRSRARMSPASPRHPGPTWAMLEIVRNPGERWPGPAPRSSHSPGLWVGRQDSHVRSHEGKLRRNPGESDSCHRWSVKGGVTVKASGGLALCL